jgi:vancomycin resistance protein VanW
MKALIPKSIRLQIRLLQRGLRDLKNGIQTQLARPENEIPPLPFSISLQQGLGKSAYTENKRHNLLCAFQSMAQTTLRPGQIFSFWKLAGAPTAKNGYKKGRNLIQGSLSEDYGGGLCQLSGILYHLALQGGMEVLERHNHTRDIYEEHERFYPLGADATVVYGYKDLRLRNPFSFPVRFEFELTDEHFTARLCSAEAIPIQQIAFERTDLPNGNKTVETWLLKSGKKKKLLAQSTYLGKDV